MSMGKRAARNGKCGGLDRVSSNNFRPDVLAGNYSSAIHVDCRVVMGRGRGTTGATAQGLGCDLQVSGCPCAAVLRAHRKGEGIAKVLPALNMAETGIRGRCGNCRRKFRRQDGDRIMAMND